MSTKNKVKLGGRYTHYFGGATITGPSKFEEEKIC